MEMWQGVHVGSVVPVFKIPLIGGLQKLQFGQFKIKMLDLFTAEKNVKVNLKICHGNAGDRRKCHSLPALVGQSTPLLWHV